MSCVRSELIDDTETYSEISETSNNIRKSLTRFYRHGEEIGCSDPASERGRSFSDLSNDGVTYKLIHSVVACI